MRLGIMLHHKGAAIIRPLKHHALARKVRELVLDALGIDHRKVRRRLTHERVC